MEIKQNKKAQMRSTIGKLIIILVSAAIIFLFLANFSKIFGKNTDKEICHDSVMLRSASIMGIEPGKSVVPLNCKTQYYCLNEGGTCPENFNVEKVAGDEEIKKKIAEKMYECWWQLGEGKADFLGVKSGKAACIICSVIAADETLQGKEIKDFMLYLQNTQVPGKDFSFLEYFTEQPKEGLSIETPRITAEDGKDYEIEDSFVLHEKNAVVFMSIKGTSFKEGVLSAVGWSGGTTAVLSYGAKKIGIAGAAWTFAGKFISKAGTKIGLKVIPGVGWFIAGATATGDIIKSVSIAKAASDNCDTAEGCSVMMVVPFEADTIAKNCDRIESIA